jgi:hypothetical protein
MELSHDHKVQMEKVLRGLPAENWEHYIWSKKELFEGTEEAPETYKATTFVCYATSVANYNVAVSREYPLEISAEGEPLDSFENWDTIIITKEKTGEAVFHGLTDDESKIFNYVKQLHKDNLNDIVSYDLDFD